MSRVVFHNTSKGPTASIAPTAPKGLYTDGLPWNKGDKVPTGIVVSDSMKRRLAKYNRKKMPTSGTPKNPKAIWACHAGIVPGDPLEDPRVIELNEDPIVVAERARANERVSLAVAKDLGFANAVILGNTHDKKSDYDPVTHIPTGEIVDDLNHITLALGNDLDNLLIIGHVYTDVDPNFIPKGLLPYRIVNGNPRCVVDLNVAEYLEDKLKRERETKTAANKSTRTGMGRG
ncbi:uncharacterized protein PG986_005239 [Apiospora aurea]|uniref:Uncharacterized protein n=1 Tax=Apiospora aurea TaxID=335848 RepID=A0ABR1QGZ8_9PEZI